MTSPLNDRRIGETSASAGHAGATPTAERPSAARLVLAIAPAVLGGCMSRPVPPNWTVVEAAEAATESEDWAAALDYWNRALIDTRGAKPEPYLEKARAMWELDDEEGAQILLDRGIERFPSDFDLRLLRGKLLCARGFERAAESDFLFAVELDPQSAEAWLLLARAQLALDRSANAEGGLDRHVELTGGGESDALYLLGRACADNGRLDKSMASFRRWFATGSADVEQLVEAASVVTRELYVDESGPYLDQALVWIDRALARQPQHAEACYVRGMILELKGDDVGAAEAYSLAVSLNDYHLPAMTRLASTYARLGDIARADAMIDRALALNIVASRRRMLERVRDTWHRSDRQN